MDWHIVRSAPRGEPKALHFLNLFGFTAYCPFIRGATRFGAKRVALFPSYVFVQANGVRSILGTPGVARLLWKHCGSKRVRNRKQINVFQRSTVAFGTWKMAAPNPWPDDVDNAWVAFGHPGSAAHWHRRHADGLAHDYILAPCIPAVPRHCRSCVISSRQPCWRLVKQIEDTS